MPMAELAFDTPKHHFVVQLTKPWGEWLFEMMPALSVMHQNSCTYGQLEMEFDKRFPGDFPLLWNSTAVIKLRENGLFVI